MKTIWSRGLIIIALAAAVLLLFMYRNMRRQTVAAGTSAAAVPTVVSRTNRQDHPASRVFRSRRKELSDAQRAALKVTFEKKLRPAVERWCEAYAGHVPFRPEALTADNFFEQIGRGTYYCVYTFMVEGITLAVEDAGGSVQVSYLNAPASKRLMELPHGTPPDPSVPITRDELAKMLKLDSGSNFPPAEIRVIPTAFSSAMNGGAQVTVGGDPINIASWKFTLVFGPDGNLNYYCRGR